MEALELRLLRCSLLRAAAPQAGSVSPQLLRAVELIEQGKYEDVFRLQAVRDVLCREAPAHSNPYETGRKYLEAVAECARLDEGEVLLMAAAVASLFIFIQMNFTGPEAGFTSFPGDAMPLSTAEAQRWDTWACGELMLDGCDIVGVCRAPMYLLLAKAFLGNASEQRGPVTRIWWISRVLIVHQRVLSERSPTLMDSLNSTYGEVVRRFGTATSVREHWQGFLNPGEDDAISASAYLETALMEHFYGHVDDARGYLDLAESFTGLKYTLEGALGYRRVCQADAKAQLVLKDEMDLSTLQKKVTNTLSQSEVLLTPKLEDDETPQFLHQKMLSVAQQSVILARCLEIKRSNPDDEIRNWKMAPYIEAVDAQEESFFMGKASCRLFRVEWEKSRVKTRERAFSLMETIVADIRGGSASVAERIQYVFSVAFPCKQALLKDYALMLVGFGSVGEALKLFEELELWHCLIDCHRLLGDKARAASLINERIKLTPEDPRLWCSLGDVLEDEQWFQKSWDVSQQRFAPAQRYLARFAMNKKQYARAVEHWELALGLNSLYADGWFSLGYAALKAGEMDKALNAFVRNVQLDPDNGEAWNNIAALNMRRKKWKEAKFAFQEALKFKRDSWQMWENYALVCYEVGNYSQVVGALSQAFDLSGKASNLFLLAKLVDVLEDEKTPVSIREAENLTELLGKLLSKVALSGQSSGEIWGLKAKWHKMVGEDKLCADALLKQVRAFQGSGWQHDRLRFQKLATSVLQLCKCYLEIGGQRELSAAQMQLQSLLKQGEEFAELDEYKSLQQQLIDMQATCS